MGLSKEEPMKTSSVHVRLFLRTFLRSSCSSGSARLTILSFAAFGLVLGEAHAQWSYQYIGDNMVFYSVFSGDSLNGWLWGEDRIPYEGLILKTTDGGET